MKKRSVSLFLSVCLVILCLVQPAFAVETKSGEVDIDEIYAQVYEEAVSNRPEVITTDEDAYAYLISNINDIHKMGDGTILIDQQAIKLSEQEKKIVSSFVKKLNTLIQLDAVTVDSKLKIHFVSNPEDTRISTRRPIANIMAEARNHASELKSVFDNALFTTKHFTAGMYFAERVKTGGVWDYKSYMGTNTLYYMEDLNKNMTGETIGNFHYGYVGRAVFEAGTLKSAAGMYQIISGTSDLGYWDSFFDDPADQKDIEWGIRMYENEH